MFGIDENILFNIIALTLGIIYGVVAQRSQFCFSGGLKDIIVLNNKQRISSAIMASVTAIIATQAMIFIYDVDLSDTRYYLNINYIFIIIGGLMFGYGMMKSDGCGSRHIVKFAQGDKTSFYILIAIGISAYVAYNFIMPILHSIDTKMSFFYTPKAPQVPIYIVLGILLFMLTKSVGSIKNIIKNIDGTFIGIIITIGWFVSSIVAEELFVLASKQSFSFIYPIGRIMVQYTSSLFDSSHLVFGVLLTFGVLLGAFISSKIGQPFISRKKDKSKTPPHLREKLIGGIFVGFGGILLIGCTVGQGLSGLSTLSLASFIAVICIYVSGYITGVYMNKKNQLTTSFLV